MSDVGALQSNLSTINDNISVVHHAIRAVEQQIDAVAQEQSNTRDDLRRLAEEFANFANDYRLKTERQFAQTRIIEVRQELEKKFGYHAEVRRHATGILQAADVAIVRDETMREAVENLMMSCPGYWLAPTLVALVGWLADKRKLAEDALAEAIRRDDRRTSLFFALVCRRAGRSEAVVRWLERYFQNQNPSLMERQVAVMLDALVNGAFGGAALIKCLDVIDTWLTELEEQPGFSDEQRKRWAEALEVKKPRVGTDEYSTLRANSPTWPALETSLSAVRRNEVVKDFFEALFTGETVIPATLEATIDFILDTLVTNFDEEELPLRREEAELKLIVEEGGDTVVAGDRYAAEAKALREGTNFGAILTNAAMYPEHSGTTRATQRYAVSRSRHWIIDGFNDLVATDRARIPLDVEIKAGSWTGMSRDGTNEADLIVDLERHYANRIESAVNGVAIQVAEWVGMGIAVLVVGYLGSQQQWVIALLGAAGIGAYFFFKQRAIEAKKLRIREELEAERGKALAILRAALAELVDLRRDMAKEDCKAAEVVKFLESIHSSQFIVARPEHARAVLN